MGGDWYTPRLIYGLRIDYSTARALLCERNRREGTWKASEEECGSFLDSDGEPYDYSEDALDEDDGDASAYCQALLALARGMCPDLPNGCDVYAVTDEKYSRHLSLTDMEIDFVFGSEIEHASPLCIESITRTEDELRPILSKLKLLLPAAAPMRDMDTRSIAIGAYICMTH